MLTVRETAELAATLQLGGDEGGTGTEGDWKARRDASVAAALDSLGLAKVADRRVGDRSLGSGGGGGGGGVLGRAGRRLGLGLRRLGLGPGLRRRGPSRSRPKSVSSSSSGGGLSGGERRRLSLAVELLGGTPRAFFADEPTTGLDSAQAQRVVDLIGSLARERDLPAVLTLHQPRATIWSALDSVVLLAPGGRVCYAGSTDHVLTHFASLGHPCPPGTGAAEFLIDLVTVDTEDAALAVRDEGRIVALAEAFARRTELRIRNDEERKEGEEAKAEESLWEPPPVRSGSGSGSGSPLLPPGPTPPPAPRRFASLLIRAWRQNMRNRGLNAIRLLGSVGQALMFAELFRSVRDDRSVAGSVADRVALLSFGVINTCMLATMKTLDLFGREKAVVTRERMRSQYTALEYLTSKALAEIPVDAVFGGAFAAVLRARTGLRTSLPVLAGTFALLSASGAALGFAVGSVSPDAESALALGVPLMVVLMAVGIINPSGVDPVAGPPPIILRWLRAASPIRWCVEALVLAEFRDLSFGGGGGQGWGWGGGRWRDLPRMGGLALVRDGNDVLGALGLGSGTYRGALGGLAVLTGTALALSWAGLSWMGPSFVEWGEEEEVEVAVAVEGTFGAERATSGPGQRSIQAPAIVRGGVA